MDQKHKAKRKAKRGEDRITGLPDKAMKKVKRSEDRINGLPDTVLGHILSYLTTEQSVRTSVLSKRWLSVWSYVPFLDLDDSSLTSPDLNKEQAILSSFIQFLNSVFNQHNASGSLQKLVLSCSQFDCYRVNEWVMSALRCGVKELCVCITTNDNFNLRAPLFAHQDLVSLRLGKNFVLDVQGEVLLPCLKKLHLDSIEFSDDESCRKLLSGCPVLEYLHMESCRMHNVKTLQIIAPALKFLLLDYYSIGISKVYEIQVFFDAPNLEVLKCVCYLAKSYSFKNLCSLNDAYIDVRMGHCQRSKPLEIRDTSLQVVNGIADAKTITFTKDTLEVLSFLDLSKLPMFNHLTKLELGGHESGSTLLPMFLANSPFLQDLVLDLGDAYYRSSWDFTWNDPIQVPQCLLDSLKSVEIWGFNGQSDMLKFMKYLVSKGKVLGELSAGRFKEEHEELKVSKEMFNLLLGK